MVFEAWICNAIWLHKNKTITYVCTIFKNRSWEFEKAPISLLWKLMQFFYFTQVLWCSHAINVQNLISVISPNISMLKYSFNSNERKFSLIVFPDFVTFPHSFLCVYWILFYVFILFKFLKMKPLTIFMHNKVFTAAVVEIPTNFWSIHWIYWNQMHKTKY